MTALAERIRRARAALKELERTPCARCGHRFDAHVRHMDGRCCHADYEHLGARPKHCRCRQFVDPAEVLV
jgi:hypothetical protein